MLICEQGICGIEPLKQKCEKKARLVLKTDFSAVREHGRKEVGPFSVMLYLKDHEPITDANALCGVICSRKFDKKAVYRNRARRLLYEAFRLIGQDLQPCKIVFIPRRAILKVKMQDVAKNMKMLFRKANLFRDSRKSS